MRITLKPIIVTQSKLEKTVLVIGLLVKLLKKVFLILQVMCLVLIKKKKKKKKKKEEAKNKQRTWNKKVLIFAPAFVPKIS